MAGPWFQPLGVFSGEPPTGDELERCAEVHRQVLPLMRAAGITRGLEPLNRFEAYLLNTCEQAIAYASGWASGGIGILYDTFHANIEEKDPIAALQRSTPRATSPTSTSPRTTAARRGAATRKSARRSRVLKGSATTAG